jgi:two-component system response regulator
MDDGTGRYAVEVLLVEDDQGDVVMITEAFEQSGAPVRLHVVGDGERAMQFLRRAGGFADAPRAGLA